MQNQPPAYSISILPTFLWVALFCVFVIEGQAIIALVGEVLGMLPLVVWLYFAFTGIALVSACMTDHVPEPNAGPEDAGANTALVVLLLWFIVSCSAFLEMPPYVRQVAVCNFLLFAMIISWNIYRRCPCEFDKSYTTLQRSLVYFVRLFSTLFWFCSFCAFVVDGQAIMDWVAVMAIWTYNGFDSMWVFYSCVGILLMCICNAAVNTYTREELDMLFGTVVLGLLMATILLLCAHPHGIQAAIYNAICSWILHYVSVEFCLYYRRKNTTARLSAAQSTPQQPSTDPCMPSVDKTAA
jgi:hypothetical protein